MKATPNTPDDGTGPASSSSLSLDDQIKAAQLAKLHAEVRHLTGISMETVGKLLVTFFGIMAAGFALWVGVPQTRLDLAKAQDELFAKKQELARESANAASLAAAAAKKAAEVTQKTEELKRKAAELDDTESRRLRSADEFARLQAEIKTLGDVLKAQQVASGKPPERDVERRIAQATNPRVFVQFAGDLNRDKVIDPLRKTLSDQGLNVPVAERINKGQNNEVRYFSQSEEQRQIAQKVADTTAAYFNGLGCPLPSLPVKYLDLQGKRSPVELWLLHSCPAR